MLLKEVKFQNELKKNGFVVIPFLSNEELDRLNTFYDELHYSSEPPNFIDDIHMTTWCSDMDYKQKVSHHLSNLFQSATDAHFENVRRLNHVFIVKRQGKQTTFKVHQDWNVVDENLYESVNVWVPLHDVDETSGALWVLKGSHMIDRKIRGAGYLFPEYGPFYEELQRNAISLKLKAGEAIVFYHSVIHGSPPNLTSKYRKAACFSVVPKGAPLCIYYQPTAQDSLLQYEPSDDFIYQYKSLRTESVLIPPDKNPVNTWPSYINKPVEKSELNQFVKTKKRYFGFFD